MYLWLHLQGSHPTAHDSQPLAASVPSQSDLSGLFPCSCSHLVFWSLTSEGNDKQNHSVSWYINHNRKAARHHRVTVPQIVTTWACQTPATLHRERPGESSV